MSINTWTNEITRTQTPIAKQRSSRVQFLKLPNSSHTGKLGWWGHPPKSTQAFQPRSSPWHRTSQNKRATLTSSHPEAPENLFNFPEPPPGPPCILPLTMKLEILRFLLMIQLQNTTHMERGKIYHELHASGQWFLLHVFRTWRWAETSVWPWRLVCSPCTALSAPGEAEPVCYHCWRGPDTRNGWVVWNVSLEPIFPLSSPDLLTEEQLHLTFYRWTISIRWTQYPEGNWRERKSLPWRLQWKDNQLWRQRLETWVCHSLT